jgi:hypothetical protein
MAKISVVTTGVPLEDHHRIPLQPIHKSKVFKFQTGGVRAYPFEEMKVGDSFLVSDLQPEELFSACMVIRSCLAKRKESTKRLLNVTIVCRVMSETSIRVWRIR